MRAVITTPKAKARRDQQLNFSFTAEELTTLRFRAGAAGMHLVDYGRSMLFGQPLIVATQTDEHPALLKTKRLILAELRRHGNNLNQIVRHLHTFREAAPPSLEPLLAELRRVISAESADDR